MDDLDSRLPMLAALLITLIGPLGVIPKFAAVTSGLTDSERVRAAILAGVYAALRLSLAVLAGAGSLMKLEIPRPTLIKAAGLILLPLALRSLLEGQRRSPGDPAKAPPSALALSPLAVPTIVSPVAVCVIIIFVAYFPSWDGRAAILAAVLSIVLLDVLAMLAARRIMALVGTTPLVLLGAVFGVMQVALALEMIFSGLSRRFGLV